MTRVTPVTSILALTCAFSDSYVETSKRRGPQRQLHQRSHEPRIGFYCCVPSQPEQEDVQRTEEAGGWHVLPVRRNRSPYERRGIPFPRLLEPVRRGRPPDGTYQDLPPPGGIRANREASRPGVRKERVGNPAHRPRRPGAEVLPRTPSKHDGRGDDHPAVVPRLHRPAVLPGDECRPRPIGRADPGRRARVEHANVVLRNALQHYEAPGLGPWMPGSSPRRQAYRSDAPACEFSRPIGWTGGFVRVHRRIRRDHAEVGLHGEPDRAGGGFERVGAASLAG